jgi:hypothetical protein
LKILVEDGSETICLQPSALELGQFTRGVHTRGIEVSQASGNRVNVCRQVAAALIYNTNCYMDVSVLQFLYQASVPVPTVKMLR